MPIWQMTGAELLQLIASVNSCNEQRDPSRVLCTGVHALAEYMQCCDATVYALKREGVLEEAIVSQVGKRIVFDGEMARKLADNFQKQRRAQHE